MLRVSFFKTTCVLGAKSMRAGLASGLWAWVSEHTCTPLGMADSRAQGRWLVGPELGLAGRRGMMGGSGRS